MDVFYYCCYRISKFNEGPLGYGNVGGILMGGAIAFYIVSLLIIAFPNINTMPFLLFFILFFSMLGMKLFTEEKYIEYKTKYKNEHNLRKNINAFFLIIFLIGSIVTYVVTNMVLV